MEFTKSLIKGKLIKRYKRFFTDLKLNNQSVTAHCPNTGSMMGLLEKDNDVWVSKHDDPKRKLKYTLEIIKVKNNLVGVNTHLANKIVAEGLKNNSFKEFNNLTNIPVLLNTSFNVKGQPIVNNPRDAIETFKNTRAYGKFVRDSTLLSYYILRVYEI